MHTQIFKAGAAKTEITPPLGTLIDGGFVTHYARSIHDPLYAKALVLQDGETTLAIVIVDICIMQQDFILNVKNEVWEKTGIRPNHLLMASTHTHGGGSVEDLLLSAADLSYRKRLQGLIVQSVQKAKDTMKPAKIAFGAISIPEHVVCRRYFMKPEYKAYNPVTGGLDQVKTNPMKEEAQIQKRVASEDTGLNYMAIQQMDGRWIGLLANYSMHYVGDWPEGTITADYFGVFAQEMQNKLQAGDDFVGILSNGTSGDANILDFLRPDRYPPEDFAKSRLIGSDLAEKVVQSLEHVQWETHPSLSVQYEELPLATRRPTKEEWEKAKKVIAETSFEHLFFNESHTGNDDGLMRIYAREQVLLYEFPDTILFPIQALKIGPVIIGGLAGEFFSETGRWLKREAPAKEYFTVCLANGYVGYVPPAQEIALGGYETWRCRSSYLEINAESLIRNRLLELIRAFR